MCILPFPRWEEILFLWTPTHLPLAPSDSFHTHSLAFFFLSCPRPYVNCVSRFSCMTVSVGFSQWGALSGELGGKEESKIREYIFSAPSWWLCPSLEDQCPSPHSIFWAQKVFLSPLHTSLALTSLFLQPLVTLLCPAHSLVNHPLSSLFSNSLEKGMATHSTIPAEKSPGQRNLEGYSPWGQRESDTTETHSSPQIQFSCLDPPFPCWDFKPHSLWFKFRIHGFKYNSDPLPTKLPPAPLSCPVSSLSIVAIGTHSES